jgi:hypothetical protein
MLVAAIIVVCVPILGVGFLAQKTVTKLEADIVQLRKSNEALIRQYNTLAAKYNVLLADYKAVYIKSSQQKLQK